MHLLDLERQSGVRPEALDGPECPLGMGYLWNWFCELSDGRGGGFSLAPIAWSEVDAWCRVTMRTLSPFERKVISAIDRKFVAIMSAKS